MKAIAEYSNPEHFDADTQALEQNWKDGNAAFGLFWASQYAGLESDSTSIHGALSLEGVIIQHLLFGLKVCQICC